MLNKCARLFEKLIEEKDLTIHTGTDKDGDSVVEFPYKGKTTRLFFCGDDGCYLSMYLVYERVPEDKIPDLIYLCNELNSEYKWFTFYVDKDNDIVIHDDAILAVDTAAEEAFELLVRMVKIGEDVKPRIMRAIYA